VSDKRKGKPTRTVVIRDVPAEYAKMFNVLVSGRKVLHDHDHDDTKSRKQHRTELLMEMIELAYKADGDVAARHFQGHLELYRDKPCQDLDLPNS